jgi:predicted SAM-dependent methyltransferase
MTVKNFLIKLWNANILIRLPKIFFSRLAFNNLKRNSLNKLNIATGPKPLEGWLNTDINPKCELYLDATRRFPIPSETIDYIFSEHFIEHIGLSEQVIFLNESYRVLKSGGKIRVTTPSIEKLIDLYLDKSDYIDFNTAFNRHETRFHEDIKNFYGFFPRDISGSLFFNDKLRLWGGHVFIHDRKSLENLLKQSGFSDIQEFNYGQSDDKELCNLENHAHDCDWMKYAETITFEATK